jgi:hypothetical protein
MKPTKPVKSSSTKTPNAPNIPSAEEAGYLGWQRQGQKKPVRFNPLNPVITRGQDPGF